MAAVRESIAHLYSLGALPGRPGRGHRRVGGAIELRYNLVADPRRRQGRVPGHPGALRGHCCGHRRRALRRTPQPGRAQEVTRELERLYQDRGYFRASIRPAPPSCTIPTARSSRSTSMRARRPGWEIAVVGNPRPAARSCSAVSTSPRAALPAGAGERPPDGLRQAPEEARIPAGRGQPHRAALRGRPRRGSHHRGAVGPDRHRQVRRRPASVRPPR